MKALFYLGHPAHYHLYKIAIKHFGKDALVVIKSKDVLEQLLKEDGISYVNVDHSSAKASAKNKFESGTRFIKRMFRLNQIISSHKPGLLAGSAAELAVLGRLRGIPSYIFFEDDFEKVAPFAKIAGPFATYLVCPDCCSAWKWNYKRTAYNSYHELAYLHPDHFTPEPGKVEEVFNRNERNFILRFSELGAYHDVGKAGITDELALTIIDRLKPFGKIFITSERKLPPQFEPYRISIAANRIHHALYYADMFIGDSQTMTAESAVLGTPALRFNDFVGELGYLEDLEHNYGLTYGFRTNQREALLAKLDELVKDPGLKLNWDFKRKKMLLAKINFADYMIRLLEK